MPTTHITRTDGIAGKAERLVITNVPHSTWDRLERNGRAPKRIKLTERRVGWFRQELIEWCEQRRVERDAGNPSFTAPGLAFPSADISDSAATQNENDRAGDIADAMIDTVARLRVGRR
jgi:predicted DNA-binding transcriptional regulator AlpA